MENTAKLDTLQHLLHKMGHKQIKTQQAQMEFKVIIIVFFIITMEETILIQLLLTRLAYLQGSHGTTAIEKLHFYNRVLLNELHYNCTNSRRFTENLRVILLYLTNYIPYLTPSN